ncbi:MAG: tetratricopeptide repeat protein [Cyclobacteriaceae bacterium]
MVKVNLTTYYKTALNLHESGKLSEARKLYQEILKLNPNHLQSRFMLGQSHYQEGNFEKAIEEYRNGLKTKPEGLNFLTQTATTYVRMEQFNDAEQILEEGIEKTGNPQLKVHLGIVRSQGGKPTEALELFESVGLDVIKNEKALFHCARALTQVGRADEAAANYKKCLVQNPKHKGALNNLANIYQNTKHYDEAATYYQEFIRYYPEDAMGYNNLAGLYEKLGELDKSIRHYQKAVTVDSTLGIAWYNMVRLLAAGHGHEEEALRLCEKGLEVGQGPFVKGLRYQQILLRQRVNDWSEFEKDQVDLQEIITSYVDDVSPAFEIVPYDLRFSDIENSIYKGIAEKFANGIATQTASRYPTVSYDHSLSPGKIKIGYYSPNFKQHPGGYLVRTLFAHHTSSEFEVHAFSLVHTGDTVNNEIQDSVDYYHDVSKLGSLEIANLINRTGIDILVSLAGYNAFMKMDVLALRPAPIQMILIGSHQTTGAAFVNYAFSDEHMMDTQLRSFFSEKMITLPVSLLLNCKLPKMTLPASSKSDHSLPSDTFIYASFNHPKKIDPRTFESWMKILKRTPNAILWLYDGGSETTRRFIIENANAQSVEPERIVFAKPLPAEQHWERFKHADLFLDNFRYNAHFTAIEILRLGKPILTLKGNDHNSKLCSSMLHYAGLDELVAETQQAYIDRAVEHATDGKELTKVTCKLPLVERNPLFDSELQMRFLEKAFKQAVLQFRKTGQYEDIVVKSLLKFDSFD